MIPFILCHAVPNVGCGIHRAVNPLRSMEKKGLAHGVVSPEIWDVSRLKSAGVSHVIWQRPLDELGIAHMRRYRESGIHMIYDIDDKVDAVSPSNCHFFTMPDNATMRSLVYIGISLCDQAHVTTDNLKDWLTSIGVTAPIKIVPNMLSRSDYALVKKFPYAERKGEKLRVGWFGGISHTGDLSVVESAILKLGDADYEWVFFGMYPAGLRGKINFEFHRPVQYDKYMQTIGNLGLDLVIAPLEKNFFNEGKSNLRLLEAAAFGLPVIASNVEPYKAKMFGTVDAPPVFALCDNETDWYNAIQDFAKLSYSGRASSGMRMNMWAEANFCFERKNYLEEALSLPKPLPEASNYDLVIVSDEGPSIRALKKEMRKKRILSTHDYKEGLVSAIENKCDILFINSFAYVTEGAASTIARDIVENRTGSILMWLSNDGPMNVSFPLLGKFSNVNNSMVETFNRVVCRDVSVELPMAGGPVVFVRYNQHLNRMSTRFATFEFAVAEWSLITGAKPVMMFDAFVAVPKPIPEKILVEEITQLVSRIGKSVPAEIPEKELTTIKEIVEEMEMTFLEHIVDYPMFSDPAYDVWKSCLISYPEQSINDWSKYTLITADNMNVTLLPNAENAMIEYAEKNSIDGLLYFDLEFSGKSIVPWMKSNPDFYQFLACDYITQCVLVSQKYVKDYIPNPQKWVLENFDKVHHAPLIAGTIEGEISLEMKEEIPQAIVHKKNHNYFNPSADDMIGNFVEFLHDSPTVAIVIFSNSVSRLTACLKSIRYTTDYKFDVIVSLPQIQAGIAVPDFGMKVFVTYRSDENRSREHNRIAWQYTYDIFCFMDDDVKILYDMTAENSDKWLSYLVGYAARDNVAFASPLLLSQSGEDGIIDSSGLVIANGIVGSIGRYTNTPIRYHILTHEVAAVHGACAVIERRKLTILSGFDPNFVLDFYTVPPSLRAKKLGWVNVCVPEAILIHTGIAEKSASEKVEIMTNRMRASNVIAKMFPEPDPYLNPNIGVSVRSHKITGMNHETLKWPPDRRSETKGNVLVLGSSDRAFEFVREGFKVFFAEINGINLEMVNPPIMNKAGPVVINKIWRLKRVLGALKIDKVVLGEASRGLEFLYDKWYNVMGSLIETER